jgi:hypothetical protein
MQMRCAKLSTSHREFTSWIVTAAMLLTCLSVAPARAQETAPTGSPQFQGGGSQIPSNQYSSGEIVNAGHHFFGGVSKEISLIVEKAAAQWGQPNGYILGEEAGGALIGGLRYGDGILYTRNAGDVRVFWQGPTIGVDAGGDGARTMMLVYSLPRANAIFDQFNGVAGAAYVIAGFGVTTLASTDERIVVVPIRSGLGLRLGYNVGYVRFTPAPTWNPF